MAEQSFLAKLGLRIGIVGSSAALAIAAPIANADYSTTANTAANRTGWYFDQTAAAEKIGMIVGGQTGPLYTRNGAVVDVLFSGNVTVGDGTGAPGIAINGAAATNRLLKYQTAGVLRWEIGANNTAEGGANAGSDLVINCYADNGAAIDTPITITRAAGGPVTSVRNMVITTGATGAALSITSNAGTTRSINYQTAGVQRWQQSVTNTAESGTNAGSDYALTAYTDAGAVIDVPIACFRVALGVMTLSRPITHNGGTFTGSQTLLNSTCTWNNAATTFTGWLLNITDTNSATASLLMDVQANSSTRFNIRKQGLITSTITDTDLLGTASWTITRTTTLTGNVTDGVQALMAPTINGAFTVTRLNYINFNNFAGTSTVTNGCALRFNAAAGTHKAVDSGTTKTTPGGVDAWMKINLNGTTVFMPLYTSKTA